MCDYGFQLSTSTGTYQCIMVFNGLPLLELTCALWLQIDTICEGIKEMGDFHKKLSAFSHFISITISLWRLSVFG